MSLQGAVRRNADPGVRWRLSRAIEQLDEMMREIRTSIPLIEPLIWYKSLVRLRLVMPASTRSAAPAVVGPRVGAYGRCSW
jgi:hypothetical protein